MTAYEYVLKTLKLKNTDNEDTQEYLHRVIVGISSLTESKWEKLPEELQVWYNDAAEVIAGGDEEAPLALIPGMDAEEETVEEEDEDETLEEIVEDVVEEPEATEEVVEEPEATEEVVAAPPARRGRKPKNKEPKPEKEAKEPKPKKEKVVKESKPKGPVAALVVRELLCDNMDMTLDELMAALAEKEVHMERSSAQVVHLNTIRAFQVAAKVGTVKNREGAVVLKSTDL